MSGRTCGKRQDKTEDVFLDERGIPVSGNGPDSLRVAIQTEKISLDDALMKGKG